MEKDDYSRIDNLEINERDGFALVRLNPKVYPIDVVYSASYSFLEKAYIILDGDAENEIVVRVRPKARAESVEAVARAFNNELLKYAAYKVSSEAGRGIRWMIVEKALSTNCGCNAGYDEVSLDDPLGIATPWEETHGKDKDAKLEDFGDSDGNKEEEYIDDPLGIAKPWEETHRREKKDE